MDNEKKVPYTWAKLKEFCNSLTEEQLALRVSVIREDNQLDILEASEIGSDHYKFDDEEFSLTREDFDPERDLDGRYASFDEALEQEEYIMTPASHVFLFEDF